MTSRETEVIESRMDFVAASGRQWLNTEADVASAGNPSAGAAATSAAASPVLLTSLSRSVADQS